MCTYACSHKLSYVFLEYAQQSTYYFTSYIIFTIYNTKWFATSYNGRNTRNWYLPAKSEASAELSCVHMLQAKLHVRQT